MIIPVAVEKLVFLRKVKNRVIQNVQETRKNRFRAPDAKQFLRNRGERVFQQPPPFSTPIGTPCSVMASIPTPIHRVAYQCCQGQGDKTEFMQRIVFGICPDRRDYERCCAPREFLPHNREETIFASARPHRVVLLYQSVSPDQSRGTKRGVRGRL